MTHGEALAIIQLLDECKRDISLKNVKKVARAIGIKVVDEEKACLEEMIQVRLNIKAEQE